LTERGDRGLIRPDDFVACRRRSGMTTTTLAAVSGQAQREEAADVGALFTMHAPFLLRVVERFTGKGAHVEDIVQEVFVVAHRRRAELRTGPEVRGWLYRVTMNVIRQHRRSLFRFFRLKSAATVEPRAKGVVPDDVAARRQEGERIRKVVLEMDFNLREVFVLHELEGLRASDIAAILEIPEGTVWSRLGAARKDFRARYEVKR
jgi:RNA polymerase sigma-70 factor, ECF subfamily